MNLIQGISGDLVVESKVCPYSDSAAMKQVNLKVFFSVGFYLSINMLMRKQVSVIQSLDYSEYVSNLILVQLISVIQNI